MTRRADKRRLANEWICRAESDLEYARAGQKETSQHHITCYLCHQAVEKALKGLLVLADVLPQKTHNLRLLIAKVVLIYPAFASLQRDVGRIDKYYIPARYPNGIDMEFCEGDAKGALEIAERLLSLAQQSINNDG